MREDPSEEGRLEARRLREHLRAVSGAARAFAEATTDYERLLEAVARVLAENVRDGCGMFLLDPGGDTLRPVAMHSVDQDATAPMRQLVSSAPMRLDEHPHMRRVLGTGEPLLIPRVDYSALVSTQAGLADAQRQLGLHSILLVAMRASGRALGVLALGRFNPESPPYNPADAELAQTLADHAAEAIQNARLYAELEHARRAAQEAEERARHSEQTHRFFFDASPIPTFVFDMATWRILAANTAMTELYGYTHEELLKLTLDDLRPPEDRERLNAALRAAGDAPVGGTGRHIKKDGGVILIEGRNHMIQFEGRKARLVVVQDQTERLRAQAERREVEERLQRTLDMMMEGYTILGHDLRYLYVNEMSARQARLTKEELLGRTPMELYPNFEQSGMYSLLMRCARDRAPVRMEEELTLQDGSKAFFEVNIRPIPEGLVILSIDATERRRTELARENLEEQLRQSQRMDAVGRLAGGIAHDFNNILSIILGYGETLLEDLQTSDPKRADVQEMHKAAVRAAELTKQLLMFSRQQLIETRVLDLNEVLTGMQKMLRRLLGEHIELQVRLDPTLGRIRADRGNIEQVIMNLSVNARDAMPRGGKLTIETSNVVLDEAFARTHLGAAPGEYVLLAVTDTGIGMDKETRLRIFEPFFTTKEPGKGTGLGLSTVFGIVQQSQGGVWVYSEPGLGSTFKVYLPRTQASQDAPRPSRQPAAPRGSEAVLLVEDDEGVRMMAQRMLDRHGYRVLVAQDAADAVRIASDHSQAIDVLLTDVVMPKMSGAMLAARLAADRPLLKVLYISGYTDGTVVAHGVLESGVSFLQKPFTSDQLVKKLRSVLDGPASAPR